MILIGFAASTLEPLMPFVSRFTNLKDGEYGRALRETQGEARKLGVTGQRACL
jgi:hypothetical protein